MERSGGSHTHQLVSSAHIPESVDHRTSLEASYGGYRPNESETPIHLTIVPSIREESFCESFTLRSNFLNESSLELGPPNLFHIAKYFGTKSLQYYQNDFTTEGSDSSNTQVKDDDGYIGLYHFVNGLNLLDGEQEVERYILDVLGLKHTDDGIRYKDTDDQKSSTFKRETMVTFCIYNVFSRSDFKAKYVIQSLNSKEGSFKMEKSFQVIPKSYKSNKRKIYNYSSVTVKELGYEYWKELQVSDLVRLFVHLDDPSKQLVGLVSNNDMIMSKEKLECCVKLLVSFLDRGELTEISPALGTITGCGQKNDADFKRISVYKNSLVSTLLRLCQLDLSGRMTDIAISEIRMLYKLSYEEDNGNFNYIILLLLKGQPNRNNEVKFVKLIHQHLQTVDMFTSQLALILVEQVKFLISKKDYNTALKIARTCVKILPLDFESWYYLTLCYILTKDYSNALLLMNSIPVIIQLRLRNTDLDIVSGMKDFYSTTFLTRLHTDKEAISEKTFKAYFPEPKAYATQYSRYMTFSKTSINTNTTVGLASSARVWKDMFLFSMHSRHPIVGNFLYQSPLVNASIKELASVSPSLVKICGPTSAKLNLSARSGGSPNSSLLDFLRESTWGRCYDLLSFFISVVNWDDLVELKNQVFRSNDETVDRGDYVVNNKDGQSSKVYCANWLEQLFRIIYEDLRTLIHLAKEPQHSAIEWNIIGILGWSVKYNVMECISSLMTSVMGAAASGGFDYFGTVKLLEIYDGLILSEIDDSKIDVYNDEYDLRFFSYKLSLEVSQGDNNFKDLLDLKYLTVDFILLNLMKLISLNVRWYQYLPNYLVTKILMKLCIRYDSVYVRGRLRIVFEQNKNSSTNRRKGLLSTMFGVGAKKDSSDNSYFEIEDTVIDYTEKLIDWMDKMREPQEDK